MFSTAAPALGIAHEREHAGAVRGIYDSSRGQRPAPVVGWACLGRQCEKQPLHLFILCGFFGAAFLQCRFAEAWRDQLLRRSFESQVERQDRLFRAAYPERRPGTVGISDEDQGQRFLQKLAQQDLFISRDGQQLAVGLAKGTLAVALGLSQRFVDPYIKANLPIKALNTIKEGTGGSNGFGTVAVMRNAPHQNAAKVYVNWLLSKEGQELYSRALTQGTRRFDIDTKWLARFNTPAAKDVTTPEEYEKVRFYGEDIITEWREPAGEFARKILK